MEDGKGVGDGSDVAVNSRVGAGVCVAGGIVVWVGNANTIV